MRFGKYGEEILVKHFLDGIFSGKVSLPGVGINRHHLWEKRTELRRRGVLLPVAASAFHLVNLPGILQVLRRLFEERGHPLWQEIKPVYEKVAADFTVLRGQESVPVRVGMKQMTKVEEMLEEGLRVSQERRQRMMAKPTLAAAEITQAMRMFCEEVGLTFSDIWTKREFGSAKNWLRLCESEGIRPRQQLRSVVRNWTRFRQGVLQNDEGRNITLRETVSFTEYFKWRRQIDAWLVAHPEEVNEPAQTDEIIWEKW